MHNDEIADLTRQLEALRIERNRISAEERAIIDQIRRKSIEQNGDRITSTDNSTAVQWGVFWGRVHQVFGPQIA